MPGTPTPTPTSNGTVVWSSEAPIVVEQGPRILAELLHSPPSWLYPVVGLLAVGIVLGGVLGYQRRGIPADAVAEMLQNLLLLGCIAGATTLVVQTKQFPYVVDVVGGVALGAAVAWVVGETVTPAIVERMGSA